MQILNLPAIFKYIFQVLTKVFDHFALSCDHQLGDEKLIEQLRRENFDLGLTEVFGKSTLIFSIR
jgi:hypothetical protein